MLVDCGHAIEVEGLEGWFDQYAQQEKTNEKTVINILKCPRCNSPIYNLRRYYSIIMKPYEDIRKVNAMYFEIDEKKKDIKAILDGNHNFIAFHSGLFNFFVCLRCFYQLLCITKDEDRKENGS